MPHPSTSTLFPYTTLFRSQKRTNNQPHSGNRYSSDPSYLMSAEGHPTLGGTVMRPASNEAASYYFNYIDRVEGDDVLGVLHSQLDETVEFLSTVSEEKSRHRYAPDKWSLRELLNHVNDTERLFVFRALWFARGFEEPLPSFDQEIAVKNSDADGVSWSDMVDEFKRSEEHTSEL